MPTKPKKLCSHAGCTQLTRGAYCEVHTSDGAAWKTTKGSAHARGYGTKWRRLRKYILDTEPICRVCGRKPATEVDHILSKARGGADDVGNLQPICQVCHSQKTNRERVHHPKAGGSAS